MKFNIYNEIIEPPLNGTIPQYTYWSVFWEAFLPVWTWSLKDSQFLTYCLVLWSSRLFVEFERRNGDVHPFLLDISLVMLWFMVLHFRIMYRGVFLRIALPRLIVNYVVVPLVCYVFERAAGIVRRRQPQEPEVDPLASFPLKPRLFPGRTTHARFFPKEHSFSYSYLMVGVPIGWQGSINNMLSVDSNRAGQRDQRAWFAVEAEDYLDRGHRHLDLQGKLRLYLRSQGVAPEDYPHAYLVTAPRFLRYSFNPVSFWYLYSHDLRLKAMILEVNNTFDERRIYFLTNDALPDDQVSPGGVSSTDSEKGQGSPEINIDSYTFKKRWPKDFHVSPFNSRKGSYSLVAHDPFTAKTKGLEQIDNTVTLNSSEGHPKLVARFYAITSARDPSKFGSWSKTVFITKWFWVGFATSPRIIKEAAKLYFLRGLHVWYRPEPLKDSIGRAETERERLVEERFRQYLKEHLERSRDPATLTYVASGSRCRREEAFSHDSSNWNRTRPATSSVKDGPPLSLTLNVLTPVFYARLARAQSFHELLRAELLSEPETDRSIWTDNVEGLLQLFGPDNERQFFSIVQLGPMDKLHWTILCRLRSANPQEPRRKDESQATPLNGQLELARIGPLQSTSPSSDPIDHPFSPLDQHVLTHCTIHEARSYRRTVTSVLIADYVFGGNAEVFDGLEGILKFVLTYWTIAALWNWSAALFSEELWVSYPKLVFEMGILHAWWVIKEWIL